MFIKYYYKSGRKKKEQQIKQKGKKRTRKKFDEDNVDDLIDLTDESLPVAKPKGKGSQKHRTS